MTRVISQVRSEAVAIAHCATRGVCPIGAICALGSEEDSRPLFPLMLEVSKGEMLWTDLRNERRVFVVGSGIFICMAHRGSDEREVPFALFGRAQTIGMAELYVPRSISQDYHLKALTDGSICSVPVKPLRRKMEAMPHSFSQVVLACALTNQAAASFAQSSVTTFPVLCDRVLALLLRLRDLANANGTCERSFALTHEDIALLVASDRVSATRVLHRLRDEGYVELGYKLVSLTDKLLGMRKNDSFFEDAFCNVNEALDLTHQGR